MATMTQLSSVVVLVFGCVIVKAIDDQSCFAAETTRIMSSGFSDSSGGGGGGAAGAHDSNGGGGGGGGSSSTATTKKGGKKGSRSGGGGASSSLAMIPMPDGDDDSLENTLTTVDPNALSYDQMQLLLRSTVVTNTQTSLAIRKVAGALQDLDGKVGDVHERQIELQQSTHAMFVSQCLLSAARAHSL